MIAALALVVAAGIPGPDVSGNARAEAIAKESAPTRDAMTYLREAAAGVRDEKLRAIAVELLERPAPTFLALWPDKDGARKALVDAGLLDGGVTVDALFPPQHTPLSFAAAPGGRLGRHHGHPGGLAIHTAFNVRSARALAEAYRAQYGVALDADLVVAAPLFHDAMKAWTLQFAGDGALLVEPAVAGSSSHHAFIVAELIHRGAPKDLVVAVASAHEPPEKERALVDAFLRAGAVLAKQDPTSWLVAGPAAPLAAPELSRGDPRPRGAASAKGDAPGTRIEASVSHLSDHDWILTETAYAHVDAALDRVLATRARPGAATPTPVDAAKHRWKKHEVLAKSSPMALYAALVAGGDAAFKAALPR